MHVHKMRRSGIFNFKNRVTDSPGMRPIVRLTEYNFITNETTLISSRHVVDGDAGQGTYTNLMAGETIANRYSVTIVKLIGFFNVRTGRDHIITNLKNGDTVIRKSFSK